MGVALEGVLIPITALLFPVLIIFIVFYFVFTTKNYRKEKLKREERMKAIEAGVELPPEPTPEPPKPLYYLRKGLVSLGVGLGLVIGGSLFAYFEKDAGILFVTTAGFVVAFIGAALLQITHFSPGHICVIRLFA